MLCTIAPATAGGVGGWKTSQPGLQGSPAQVTPSQHLLARCPLTLCGRWLLLEPWRRAEVGISFVITACQSSWELSQGGSSVKWLPEDCQPYLTIYPDTWMPRCPEPSVPAPPGLSLSAPLKPLQKTQMKQRSMDWGWEDTCFIPGRLGHSWTTSVLGTVGARGVGGGREEASKQGKMQR